MQTRERMFWFAHRAHIFFSCFTGKEGRDAWFVLVSIGARNYLQVQKYDKSPEFLVVETNNIGNKYEAAREKLTAIVGKSTAAYYLGWVSSEALYLLQEKLVDARSHIPYAKKYSQFVTQKE